MSYPLARRFAVGITEVDDLYLVLECLTTPEQQPVLHYWRTHPDAAQLPAEQIVELLIAVSRVLSPAITAVMANHLDTQTPLVLEGDFLLPELLARQEEAKGLKTDRVRGVFLYEKDERQLLPELCRAGTGGRGAEEKSVCELAVRATAQSGV